MRVRNGLKFMSMILTNASGESENVKERPRLWVQLGIGCQCLISYFNYDIHNIYWKWMINRQIESNLWSKESVLWSDQPYSLVFSSTQPWKSWDQKKELAMISTRLWNHLDHSSRFKTFISHHYKIQSSPNRRQDYTSLFLLSGIVWIIDLPHLVDFLQLLFPYWYSYYLSTD